MSALNPQAFAICVWMYFGFAAVWLIGALRAKSTAWREGVGSRLLYSVPLVLAFVLVFSHAWEYGWLQVTLLGTSGVLSALGVALTATGLSFAIWARLHIGGNWSSGVTLKSGHELVRSGPYRLVRHPIYTGMLLAITGTALTNLRVRSLVGVACLLLGFSIKSRIEERLMQRTFGPEYTAYKADTGALMPRL